MGPVWDFSSCLLATCKTQMPPHFFRLLCFKICWQNQLLWTALAVKAGLSSSRCSEKVCLEGTDLRRTHLTIHTF